MMEIAKKSNSKPHVGVGVIIRQKQKIILGHRLNSPMSGSWQLPGGWIRLGETPEHSVQRQVKEFKDLKVGKSRFVTFTNNVFDQYTHSLSLYFVVDCLNQEQPFDLQHKINSDWVWAGWNDLPEPLFLPLQLLKQSGFSPFLTSSSSFPG